MLALTLALTFGQFCEAGDCDLPPPPLRFWTRQRGAFFEFAPASGAGIPSAQTLCSLLAESEKVGNWGCLQGDGAMAPGSVLTFLPQNTPTDGTSQVCVNGLDCGVMSARALNGTNQSYDTSASTAAPTALTVCAQFVPDQVGAFYDLVSRWGSANQYTLLTETSGAASFYVSDGTTVTSNLSGIVTQAGQFATVCARYLYSGTPGGTSSSTVCSSTQAACVTSAAQQGPLNAASGIRRIGGRQTGANFGGRVFSAFVTDADLGAARIAAIVAAASPSVVTGAKGEALTFTRATPRFCESSTGLGSVVPSGVPCIGNGGVSVWRVGTVISARSNELDNAYWTKTATVTANQARAPDGTLSADQLSDGSAVASQGVSVAIASTSATQHTFACFVSAGTTDQATISITGTGSATGDCTASFTGISATGQWISCSSPAAYAGTLTAVTPSLVVGDNAADTGTIFASYCNHFTTQPYRAPAIRTVAAGATRNAESLTSAVAISQATQCQGATVNLAGTSSYDRIWTMSRVLSGSGNYFASYTQALARTEVQGGSLVQTTGAGSAFGGSTRFVSRWDGATLTLFRNGTQVATQAGTSTVGAATIVGIGSSPAGVNPADGTISAVQFDPDPTRCTP